MCLYQVLSINALILGLFLANQKEVYNQVSLNSTPISLNNTPVSLLTISSQL